MPTNYTGRAGPGGGTICLCPRIGPIDVQHSDVPIQRLIDLVGDLNEPVPCRVAGPAGVALEGEPIDAGRDPLVVEDQDLGVSVLNADDAQLVTTRSEIGLACVAGSHAPVVGSVAATDVKFDASPETHVGRGLTRLSRSREAVSGVLPGRLGSAPDPRFVRRDDAGAPESSTPRRSS